MDVFAFTSQLRDHYIAQFKTFAAKRKASCDKGSAEVKLRLGEQSSLYECLYCVDFLADGGVVELCAGKFSQLRTDFRSPRCDFLLHRGFAMG